MDELLGYTPASTSKDIVLALRQKMNSLPKGEDFDFTFRTAAALHTIILSKEMAEESREGPGWDSDETIERAGKAQWGYSCLSIPELTTTMRQGAVFFSNNKNLNLMNVDIRRIVSMIKPFGDGRNLKIAAALYQLTVHSEEAYAAIDKISEKANLPADKVRDCLLGELAPFVLEKDSAEGEFRFEGMYRHIIPILSLLDIK